MTNLTPKQQRIYDFIRTFTRQMGYPPTVREIGQHLSLIHISGPADPAWAAVPPLRPLRG